MKKHFWSTKMEPVHKAGNNSRSTDK